MKVFNLMKEQLQTDFDNIMKTSSFTKRDIELKQNSLNEFIKTGFPNRRQENWKFYDLNQIIKKNIYEYFHTANNDLVHAAKKINPRIGNVIEYLKKQKMCDFVQMTGSGSCCFAIFKSKKTLLKCEKLVKTRYRSYWTAKTKTIT